LPITSCVAKFEDVSVRCRGTLPAATLPLDKDGALHASPPAGNLPLYPEFALAASDGRDRRLADFRGLVVALSVGYTQCPDVCPTTLSELKAAVEGLSPAQRRRVQVLFATLDPDRDGLAMLKEYAAAFSPASGRPVLGLRGSTRATAALISQLQLVAERKPSGGAGYTVDHTAGVFLFDANGRLRGLAPYGPERRRVAPRPCPPAG
jgi:cytochrome oxidase Cu insertion factor (SCO1/SenC/PrrC family)